MKKFLFYFFSLAFVAAAFFFLGREFFHYWGKIRTFSFDFHLPTLLAACLLQTGAFLFFSAGWHLILAYLRNPIPFFETFLYFCITQPAKYIPGKIWLPVARIKFCETHAVSAPVTLLTTGIEAVMEIFAGAYISILALLQLPAFHRYSLGGTLLVIALGILLVLPRVFYWCINVYLRIVKKPAILPEEYASFQKLLGLQIIYIIGMILLGLASAFFVRSFTGMPMRHFPLVISISAFSYVASLLVFFAPGGLGVREGIWFFGLKTIATAPIALIASVASRVWIMAMETLLALIALFGLWGLRSHRTSADRRR